jgi:hypothetical protein
LPADDNEAEKREAKKICIIQKSIEAGQVPNPDLEAEGATHFNNKGLNSWAKQQGCYHVTDYSPKCDVFDFYNCDL